MAGDRQGMRKGWRPLVAIAASWILVLQVLLTGLTMVGQPASAAADGFAAAICTPDGIRPAPGHSDAPGDPHGLTCCLIGCAAAGPLMAPPAASTAVSAPATAAAPSPAALVARTVAGLHWSPSSARAPPPTV